jgi:hypothetical protein
MLPTWWRHGLQVDNEALEATCNSDEWSRLLMAS